MSINVYTKNKTDELLNNKADTTSITTLTEQINSLDTSKQATLVSGTNIKTINGESVLGSGNITISGASVDTSDFAIKTGSNTFTGDQTFDDKVIVSGTTQTSGITNVGALRNSGVFTNTGKVNILGNINNVCSGSGTKYNATFDDIDVGGTIYASALEVYGSNASSALFQQGLLIGSSSTTGVELTYDDGYLNTNEKGIVLNGTYSSSGAKAYIYGDGYNVVLNNEYVLWNSTINNNLQVNQNITANGSIVGGSIATSGDISASNITASGDITAEDGKITTSSLQVNGTSALGASSAIFQQGLIIGPSSTTGIPLTYDSNTTGWLNTNNHGIVLYGSYTSSTSSSDFTYLSSTSGNGIAWLNGNVIPIAVKYNKTSYYAGTTDGIVNLGSLFSKDSATSSGFDLRTTCDDSWDLMSGITYYIRYGRIRSSAGSANRTATVTFSSSRGTGSYFISCYVVLVEDAQSSSYQGSSTPNYYNSVKITNTSYTGFTIKIGNGEACSYNYIAIGARYTGS